TAENAKKRRENVIDISSLRVSASSAVDFFWVLSYPNVSHILTAENAKKRRENVIDISSLRVSASSAVDFFWVLSHPNGAKVDDAVALGCHAIFHVQDKIRELTLVIAKEAIAFAGTVQEPVANRPDRPELAILVFVILSALRNPAVQVFAVEDLETLFLLTLHETVTSFSSR